MGGSIGLAILATVAASRTSHTSAGGKEALTEGFHAAFALGAGFAVAGALAALLVLPRIRPPRRAATASSAPAGAGQTAPAPRGS
jgi:hypothetical protein